MRPLAAPLAKMREFEKFRKNQKIVRTFRARLARLSGPQETQNARGWEYEHANFRRSSPLT